MCESKSGSDYINASFVNVSDDVMVVQLVFVYLHRVTSREMPT